MLKHDQSSGIPWRPMIDTLASIATVGAACVVVWALVLKPSPNGSRSTTTSPSEALPAEPVSLKGAELKGDRGARVVLIEYSDFQCPYCSKFANETLPELQRRYVDSGKVLFAFRHFPLESIHPFAFRAAEVATCAGQQGKFWQIHDALFGGHVKLDEAVIDQRAQAVDLNRATLSSCLNSDTEAAIRADLVNGRAAGVVGTPTFLIGRVQSDGRAKITERLRGARAEADFVDSLDRVLRSGH